MNENMHQEKWVTENAKYGNGELLIKGYQVMQDWESDYMRRLAQIATSHGGSILELGFGLGISAGFIQQASTLKKHTVAEAHPDVIEFARQQFPEALQTGRMEILPGFWEATTRTLKDEMFDGILFDTSPLHQETEFFHYLPFFPEAYRLLKVGGIFTYFSDEADCLSEQHMKLLRNAGFSDIQFEVVPVNPPKDCRYWQAPTIVAPIIRKSA